MWISLVAIAIALALFAQVAAFFLHEAALRPRLSRPRGPRPIADQR